MADRIYIIGHVNPDTDTLAAAIGYAWLLRERDGSDTIAARAGAVNPQMAWVLRKVGLDAPIAMRDKRALDFAMLMVIDVVNGSSRILLTDELPQLSDLPYPPQSDGARLAEGTVSQKNNYWRLSWGYWKGR